MTETTIDTTTNQGGDIVLDVQNLVVEFKSGRQRVQAVSGITFQVNRGEVVCLIGPSGSGKSTLLRCANVLETIDGGRVVFDGIDLQDKHSDVWTFVVVGSSPSPMATLSNSKVARRLSAAAR